ncbi:MAG: hypothetical protein ACRCZF_08195 [Gemmataceae bacterium]
MPEITLSEEEIRRLCASGPMATIRDSAGNIVGFFSAQPRMSAATREDVESRRELREKRIQNSGFEKHHSTADVLEHLRKLGAQF